jgi:hypothetical protein
MGFRPFNRMFDWAGETSNTDSPPTLEQMFLLERPAVKQNTIKSDDSNQDDPHGNHERD